MRENVNMLDMYYTKVQIIADVLEKGSSIVQALAIVNNYYNNIDMDKISRS